MQKVKNLLHRNKDNETTTSHTAPVAPVAHHNPLDRNLDGRVDAADLTSHNTVLAPGMTQTTTTTTTTQNLETGNVYNNLNETPLRQETLLREEPLVANQTAYVQSAQRASLVRNEPTVLEVIQKDVVVHERIHPVEKEEIQPIIYREREQLDVKQVTQMMHETQIQPTLVQQRELAPEYREAIVERSAPIEQNIILLTTHVSATERSQVLHAPIIEETIRKTVIEEVQPVLERDVYQPTIIQNTQAIHEKIIEAPTVYRETTQVRELGTRSVGMDTAYVQTEMLPTQTLSSTYELEQQRLLNSQTQTHSLSQGTYDQQRLSQGYASQPLVGQQQSLVANNILPTGQVLPQVASSRPAYSYLPSNYTEQRPNFIGTSSDYVRAASGLPQSTLAHTKNLPTVHPGTTAAPLAAPVTMQRQ